MGKSRQLCEINSLASKNNMAASIQYVMLPEPTLSDLHPAILLFIYNIWQQPGLTMSCLSFQNKRPIDNDPTLIQTQTAAFVFRS